MARTCQLRISKIRTFFTSRFVWGGDVSRHRGRPPRIPPDISPAVLSSRMFAVRLGSRLTIAGSLGWTREGRGCKVAREREPSVSPDVFCKSAVASAPRSLCPPRCGHRASVGRRDAPSRAGAMRLPCARTTPWVMHRALVIAPRPPRFAGQLLTAARAEARFAGASLRRRPRARGSPP